MTASKKTTSTSKTRKNDTLHSAPKSDMKQNETRVEIKPAKGRPMLTWVGKKPLRYAIAYPAQLVETFHAAPLSNANTDG